MVQCDKLDFASDGGRRRALWGLWGMMGRGLCSYASHSSLRDQLSTPLMAWPSGSISSSARAQYGVRGEAAVRSTRLTFHVHWTNRPANRLQPLPSGLIILTRSAA